MWGLPNAGHSADAMLTIKEKSHGWRRPVMSIERCFNLDDFRELARRRLPEPLFHFMDGGADDEATLRRNVSAFDACQLLPSSLADTSNLDISTTVLGQNISWPVILSPTGINRLFHHEGERAVARAAAKSGTIYSLSTMSNVSIEEIGALTVGPQVFPGLHTSRSRPHSRVRRALQGRRSMTPCV